MSIEEGEGDNCNVGKSHKTLKKKKMKRILLNINFPFADMEFYIILPQA